MISLFNKGKKKNINMQTCHLDIQEFFWLPE